MRPPHFGRIWQPSGNLSAGRPLIGIIRRYVNWRPDGGGGPRVAIGPDAAAANSLAITSGADNELFAGHQRRPVAFIRGPIVWRRSLGFSGRWPAAISAAR